VNELTGERMINSANIREDIRAIAIQPVGRYAQHIIWSDGHSTGLYGFELLRKLDTSIQQN
jgi:DUF971 family protein